MPQLDWSLAQIPDFAGNALKARDDARLRNNDVGEQNALKLYASDPTAGTQQLLQYNPKLAISLQAQQQATQQQAAEQKRTALLAAAKAVAPVLSSIPPEQRAQKLLENAPQIKQMFGLDDATIQQAASGDLSDQALALWTGQDPNATTPKEIKNADGSTSYVYLPTRAPPAYAQQGAPQAASAPQAAPTAAQPAQAAPAPSGGGFDGFYGDYLAKVEGGYSPEDGNGAPVNFGINQKSNPDVNVARLTPEQAKKITYERYWKPSGADDLPPALAAVQADTAFNMGIPAAKQLLAQSGGDPQKYLDLRAARYQAIAQANPGKARFLPTWLDRNQQLAAYVQGQGQQAPQAAPAPPEAAPAPRAPGYVNGVYTVPGDAAPAPEWVSDGKGGQRNVKTGKVETDPTTAAAGWQVLVDPKTQENFRYNPRTGEATTLSGEPYKPQGAARMSGGAPRSAIAMATQRFLDENPNATAEDISQFNAHLRVQTAASSAFATGKQGQAVNSFNVAIQHLDMLGDLAKAMDNGDIRALNQIANTYKTETGNPAPTNLNAAKQIVGDEIVKAVVGAGGGVGDRDKAAKAVDGANSPQQLLGVIQTYKGLMAGQLNGLRLQYKNTTGLDDFETKLLPETRRQLEAHDQGAAPTKPPKASGARQGANGKFYAPDPNRPGSFPQIYQGDDGVWRMKSANGQVLKMVE